MTSGYIKPDHRQNPSDHDWQRHSRRVNWEIDKEVELRNEFFGHIPLTVKELTSTDCHKIKQAYLEQYPGDLELKAKLDKLLPNGVDPPSPPPPEDEMKALLEQFGQIIAYGSHSTLIVPENLYVIATMNSADRSIGHTDVAIRRRFGLFPLGPNSEVVRDFWSDIDESWGRRLAELMHKMNEDLTKDHEAIGEAELGVGHSYFLPKRKSSVEEARQQVRMKLLYQVRPLLRVYAELLSRESDLQECFDSLDEVIAQL